MAFEVGDLFIRLGLDPTDLERGMDRARQRINQFANEYQALGANLTAAIDRMIKSGKITPEQISGRLDPLLKSGQTLRQSLAQITKDLGVAMDQGLSAATKRSKELTKALSVAGAPDFTKEVTKVQGALRVLDESFKSGRVSAVTYDVAVAKLSDKLSNLQRQAEAVSKVSPLRQFQAQFAPGERAALDLIAEQEGVRLSGEKLNLEGKLADKQRQRLNEEMRLSEQMYADELGRTRALEVAKLKSAKEQAAATTRLQADSARALQAFGVADPWRNMQDAASRIKVLGQALDQGIISQQAYAAALLRFNEQAREYNRFLDGAPKKILTSAESHQVLMDKMFQTGRAMRRVGEDMTFMGLRLTAAISAPLGAAAFASLKFAGDIEKASASMGRMIGNIDVGSRTIQRIRELVLKTPFEFEGVVEGTRRLAAMGFQSDKLVDMFQTLGDTIAGVGGDTASLNRLIKALGDIQAKGFLAAEEIRQLSNIPVPTYQILAEQLGKNMGEILSQMKKKQIDAATAIEAILTGLNKRFGGQMATIAETLPGIWKRVTEKAKFAAAEIGTAFLPLAKDVGNALLKALDSVRSLSLYLAGLPTPIKGVIAAFTGLLVAIGPLVFIFGQLVGSAGHLLSAFTKMEMKLGGVVGMFGLLGRSLGVVALAYGAYQLLNWAINAAVAGTEAIGLTRNMKLLGEQTKESKSAWDSMLEGMEAARTIVTGGMDLSIPTIRPIGDIQQEMEAAVSKLKPPIVPVQFIPLTAGGDVTNVFKEETERRVRRSLDLIKALADEAEKARDKLSKMYAKLGVEDVEQNLHEVREAMAEIYASLTPIQKLTALDTLSKSLRAAAEVGVISSGDLTTALGKIGKAINDLPDIKLAKVFKTPTGWLTPFEQEVREFGKLVRQLQLEKEGWEKTGFGFMRIKDYESTIPIAIDQTRMFANVLDEAADSGTSLGSALARLSKIGVTWIGGEQVEAIDRLNHAFKTLKLTPPPEDKMNAKEALDAYRVIYENFMLGVVDDYKKVAQAYVNMVDAQLAAGGRLTRDQKRQYREMREVAESEISKMRRAWNTFTRQVSTVLTDLSRGIFDILFPKNAAASGAEQNIAGVAKRIFDIFQDAFIKLSEQGFADPVNALNQVIQKIREAGTVAQANEIALRHFGQSGPEIARLIREGTLSVSQLNAIITEAAKTSKDFSATTEEEGSKIQKIWREVGRAISRALLEEGAKAISVFLGKHIKALLEALGGVLAKLFGIKKAVADVANLPVPDIFKGGGGISVPPPPSPPSPTGAPSPPSGGTKVGTPGMGASDAVGIVTGVVSAVANVISAVYSIRQEGTLNAIEESTRYVKIATVEGENSISRSIGFIREYTGYTFKNLADISHKMDTVIDLISSKVGGAFSPSGAGGGEGAAVAQLGYVNASLDTIKSYGNLGEKLDNIYNRVGEFMQNMITRLDRLIAPQQPALATAAAMGGSITINVGGGTSGSIEDAERMIREGARIMKLRGVRGRRTIRG